MTQGTSAPAADERAFDTRFRWLVLQEMRPLQGPLDLSTTEEIDEVYGVIRDRTIAVLRGGVPDPLLADAVQVKVAARQFVAAILEDALAMDPERRQLPYDDLSAEPSPSSAIAPGSRSTQ
jgi:hypothetical protein